MLAIEREERGWAVVSLDGKYACVQLDRKRGQVSRPLSQRERRLTGCHTVFAGFSGSGIQYIARWVSRVTAMRQFRAALRGDL
jgi:hypothetical protein